MAYNRDSAELREALDQHSVEGYPVEVPTYGEGHIVRQGGTGPIANRNTDTGVTQRGAPQPFFVVRIKNPMPFSKYAESKRLSKDLLTPAKWEELLESHRAGVLLGDETLKRLEAGESVSRWEAEYEAMYDGGQLDGDGNIIYANFFPGQVEVPEGLIKRDMLVEITEGSEKAGLPGRYWGSIDGGAEGKVAYLELFSPLPYMEAPDAIASPFIKPEFISKFTYALGYGTAQTWELMKGKLPKGKYAEGTEKIYYLEEAIPLSKITKLCKDYTKRELPGQEEPPHCVWQAVILNILPVYLKNVTVRPLPEHVITGEMVVSFDEE